MGLKLHSQKRLFKGVQSKNNQIQNAKSSEVIIQTCWITENTLYLFGKKNLRPFQTYLVVIFEVKGEKNITNCTKLIFQGDQKHQIIHSKQ